MTSARNFVFFPQAEDITKVVVAFSLLISVAHTGASIIVGGVIIIIVVVLSVRLATDTAWQRHR